MSIRWSSRAARDLLDIHAYILTSSGSGQVADQWVSHLRKRAREMKSYPNAGRVVPEYAQESLREVFLKDYRIVYLVAPDSIVIITVFHGSKQIAQLP